MLKEAAVSSSYFEDVNLAMRVAEFLGRRAQEDEMTSINLRTLQMGYEIAKANPETWKILLEKLIPQTDPRKIVEALASSMHSVEEQAREFRRTTGLSRRTFFNYRKESTLGRLEDR